MTATYWYVPIILAIVVGPAFYFGVKALSGGRGSHTTSLGLVGAGALFRIAAPQIANEQLATITVTVGTFLIVIGAVDACRRTAGDWRAIVADDIALTTSIGLMAASGVFFATGDTIALFGSWAMLLSWFMMLGNVLLWRIGIRLLKFSKIQGSLIFIASVCNWLSQVTGNVYRTRGIEAFAGVSDAAMTAGGVACLLVMAHQTWKGYTLEAITRRSDRTILWLYSLGIAAIASAEVAMAGGQIGQMWVTWLLTLTFLSCLVWRVLLAIRDSRSIAREARRSAEYFESVIGGSSDVILICSPVTYKISFASPAAENVLEKTPAELAGMHLTEALNMTLHDVMAAARAVGYGHTPTLESRLDQKILETVLTSHSDNVIATIRDVSERDALRRELHTMAFHDPTTDLSNRHRAYGVLQERLAEDHDRVALLLIDIDRFKQVNDSGGHQLGDQVLRIAAQRLRNVVDPGTHLARLGGDEFLAIVDAMGCSPEQVAARIATEMASPFVLQERTFQLGASVGVAHAADAGDATELMRRADIAMYSAKRNKQALVTYEAGLSREALGNVERDAVIADVIREQRFRLVAQPLVELASGSVSSVETLVRWVDNHETVQGPWPLLDFAQRTGQMRPITDWVLDEALMTVKRSPGLARLSVNVPPEDLLDPALPDRIAARLAEHDVSPDRLTVELTEDELIGQAHRRTGVIHSLRELGVRVVIDDFGSGYSSLGYLLKLPISGFKIDRSFVSMLPKNRQARSIVSSLVHFAIEHDFSLVAEGVETQQEHLLLRDLGCPTGQGFFYGMPQDVRTAGDLSHLSWWSERTADSWDVLVDSLTGGVRPTVK